jgi:phosphoribosyl-ATP pyrophosphohydrolase/phosphoribosyl-AMP cyclohydrolase
MLGFDEKKMELIPAIVQDVNTREVLMLAYMNEEALRRTLETRRSWFWSRSRQELWCKGETSGNKQFVKEVRYDCDEDTILLLVEQIGPACHTGHRTCFYRSLLEENSVDSEGTEQEGEKPRASSREPRANTFLNDLYRVIVQRKEKMPEGSYTAELLSAGSDKILKKMGEELAELLLAAKGEGPKRVVAETSDLLYHLLVFLAAEGIPWSAVEEELGRRRR